MAATAAIFHHPDAIERPDTPLAGRRIAGQSFLAGYVRHVEADRLHSFAHQNDHLDKFRKLVADYGWTGPVDTILAHEPDKLRNAGVAMLPGPNLASFAWTRRRAGQALYSLCGITHTVATKRIMDGLMEGVSAPVERWDAIICTSRAVQRVVATQLDAVEAYLGQRFMAARLPRPQLPVIPLGIDTGRFGRVDAERARWRQAFEADDETVVLMSMGRRTVAEKMHPVPMFQAAEMAAKQTGKKVALWMVGWFADEPTEEMHRSMAKEFAPSVDVRFPDGKDNELRYEIWSAADIFTLPVDNIQETYGLAPVEAMAAGLPVVVSDWDGFRDTVEHGVTGIRVPTRMSRPGTGIDIAERFEDGRDVYHQYLVAVHQRTAIDVRGLAGAYAALIKDPDLRAKMGQAGVQRARTHYDWSAIVPQYQALWGELNAIRAAEPPSSERVQGAPSNPAAMDPFTLYASYPAQHLLADTVLTAEAVTPEARLEELVDLTGARRYRRIVARSGELAAVQAAIHQLGPVRYQDLLARSSGSAAKLESCVFWLLKFDLIQIVQAGKT
ncbi:MAG: glycosyltransferase family 4 protein [Pseudomonadota bacterium]